MEFQSRSKVKILYINPNSYISGSGMSLLALIKDLDKSKFIPYVVLPDHGSLEQELLKYIDNIYIVKMVKLKRGFANLLDFILSFVPTIICLYKVVKHENITIIHVNSLMSPYGLIVAKLTRTRCIYHIRENEKRYPKFIFRFLTFLVSWLADRIIVVAKSIANPFERVRYKVTVIYNGVDINKFKPKIYPQYLRSKLGIENKIKLLVVVAGIGEKKGQLFVIEALPKVLIKFKNIKVLFIGSIADSGRRKIYYDYLQGRIQELNLREHVLFLGAMSDPLNLMLLADICVSPSLVEAFPRVNLEAMALAKPVISTDTGGCNEQIDHRLNGYLVPPGDSEALAKAIVEILCDEEMAREMGSRARRKVIRFFSSSKITLQIENLYEKIV